MWEIYSALGIGLVFLIMRLLDHQFSRRILSVPQAKYFWIIIFTMMIYTQKAIPGFQGSYNLNRALGLHWVTLSPGMSQTMRGLSNAFFVRRDLYSTFVTSINVTLMAVHC